MSEVLVVQAAVFIVVSVTAMLILRAIPQKSEAVEGRFSEYFGEAQRRQLKVPQSHPLARILVSDGLARLSKHVVPDSSASKSKLQQALIRGGYYDPTALSNYCIVKLSLMIGPPLCGLILGALNIFSFNRTMMFACIAGALGSLLPGIWLRWRTSERQQEFRQALPDFLDLLIACLEGGIGFQAALKRVAEELVIAHPVLAGEVSIAQREIELGTATDRAVRNLAERSGLEEFDLLGTFVQQSLRLGTTSADAMRELSDLLRKQRENRLEEYAHKASVKILIPTMLFIMPAIFIVLVGPAAIMVKNSILASGHSTSSR